MTIRVLIYDGRPVMVEDSTIDFPWCPGLEETGHVSLHLHLHACVRDVSCFLCLPCFFFRAEGRAVMVCAQRGLHDGRKQHEGEP